MGAGPKGFGFVNISLCLIFLSKLDVRSKGKRKKATIFHHHLEKAGKIKKNVMS